MGAAFYIVLDREDPGFDTSVDGKYLAREAGRLGGLADRLGLDHLDSYVSFSPDYARSAGEEFAEFECGTDGPPGEEFGVTEERWFDPEEGIRYFSRLLDASIEHAPRFKHPAGVAEDLRGFKKLLERARSIGARWHLEVGF